MRPSGDANRRGLCGPVPQVHDIRSFPNAHLLQTHVGSIHEIEEAHATAHQDRHHVNIHFVHETAGQVLGSRGRAAKADRPCPSATAASA